MKPLISLRGATKSFQDLVLFRDVNVDIFSGDKIGLIGRNGTGKSTFLRLLIGLEPIDVGDVETRPEMKVGHLTQYQIEDTLETVGEQLAETDYSTSLRGKIGLIEERMADPGFYEEPGYEETMQRYNELQSEYARYSGSGYLDRAMGMLDRLGSPGIGVDAMIKDLSGGERRKVALAKVLVASNSMDLLLLDEPTNHLDIGAIEWLEEFMLEFEGTIIIVSHDRYLLDDTVSRIFEIENKSLETWRGDYTDFVEQKTSQTLMKRKAYKKQQKEIQRHKAFIEKMKGRNRFNAQIKSKLRRLDKMDRLIDPFISKKTIKFSFRSTLKGSKNVAEANGLSMAFGDNVLFQDAEFEIQNGEKVGLIGPNGCGKTTFLKMLIKDLDPTEGTLQISKGVKTGYFDQGHLSLEPENDLIQELRRVNDRLAEEDAKALLGRFMFKGNMVYSPVKKLSGGERARLAIMKLVMSPCNLLVLDEPTNHLDLDSRFAVESALNAYKGTIVMASHDRYFLDKVANHVLAMDGSGNVHYYPGNYTQWRSIIAREEERRLAMGPPEMTYVVRKGYTDWSTGTRFTVGQELRLRREELSGHQWALETKHLVVKDEQEY